MRPVRVRRAHASDDLIDIGIADPYGGHLGAWVQDGGDARAVYPDGPTDLEDPA